MRTNNDARRLAAITREAAIVSFDVEAGLRDLRATSHGRRRFQILGAVAATAALIFGTALLISSPRSKDPSTAARPTTPPSPSISDPDSVDEPGCGAPPTVQCLGSRSFVVDSSIATYQIDLPRGFSTEPALLEAPEAIDVYQNAPGVQAGVTILLGVTLARANGPDTLPDAKTVAQQVAALPFLTTSTVKPTSISGLTAWKVDTQWAVGTKPAELADSCNGSQHRCLPVLTQQRSSYPWEIGIWQDMVGSYTFVDLPDGNVAVLWSWAFERDHRALAANDRLLKRLVLTPNE